MAVVIAWQYHSLALKTIKRLLCLSYCKTFAI